MQEPGEADGQSGTGAQEVPGETSETRGGRQLWLGKYGIVRLLVKTAPLKINPPLSFDNMFSAFHKI